MNLKTIGKRIKGIFSIRRRSAEQVQQRYLQWYEKDPERLKWEVRSMQVLFPQLQLIRLNDSRLAFRGNLNRYSIAVIFPYLYPLEPPQVLIFEGQNQTDDSSRTKRGFLWKTDMPAAGVLQQIHLSLEV